MTKNPVDCIDGEVDGLGGPPIFSSEARDTTQALPWRYLLAICACNAAHFYSVCSLFSYAGIMTADLGWSVDRDQAGFVAGYLQSANTLGRIFTSSLWGCFDASFGHKRSLLISMTFLSLGCGLFGFCTNFWAAIAVRCLLLGACNGFVALFPVLSMEVAGAERQTEVVGIVFASGSFIQLLGPALGGWTYGVSSRFPAVIPNLIGMSMGCLSMIALWHWAPAGISSSGLVVEGPRPTFGQAICNPPVPLLILLRTVQGYVSFSFFEVVPLWAISSRGLGGLALSENDVGLVLSGSAVGTALFLSCGMPILTKVMGLRLGLVTGCAAGLVAVGAMPWALGLKSLVGVHFVASSGILQMGAVLMACLNNCSPPEHRSVISGVTVTFESLAKGLGPMVSSVAFAWTLARWGRAGHSAVFLLLAAVLLVTILGTGCLPDSVEQSDTGEKRQPAQRRLPAVSAPKPVLIGSCRLPSEDFELGGVQLAPLEDDRKNMSAVNSEQPLVCSSRQTVSSEGEPRADQDVAQDCAKAVASFRLLPQEGD